MPLPNLRHLQAFHEVVSTGSISAAAVKMHLTQSAVTQAIAAIERHFDTQLFTRSCTGMHATAAGLVCAERVKRALNQLREGLDELVGIHLGAAERDQLFLRMSSTQLDSLIKLVEFRNFSHAARASGVSQPTIHRAARTLERTVGTTLFERTSYGVVPTRDADKLSRRAHLAIVEITQTRADMDALRGRESGSTIIGVMSLSRTLVVPNAVMRFAREHAEHAVSIIEGSYDQLLTALRAGQADFLMGELREPRSISGILHEHLLNDPLSIVARPDHPLARKRRLSRSDLAGYPWIAPLATSPLRPHFDALFDKLGAKRPDPCVECNSLSVARAFLMQGEHLMLAPISQFHYELQAGLLVCLPHAIGTRSIGLTMREDWRPTRTQARLLTILRDAARTYVASGDSLGDPSPMMRRRA